MDGDALVRAKVEGYAELNARYGPGRLADALLAKWLADPDAGEAWETLAASIKFVGAAHHVHGTARSQRPSEKLSPREVEVLTLFARGFCAPAVASKLLISTHTVRQHITKASLKLGTRAIAHTVAVAIRGGQVVI